MRCLGPTARSEESPQRTWPVAGEATLEFTELHDWDVSPLEAKAIQAAALSYRYLPLLVSEGQPKLGLALRKEALRPRGLFAHASVREPGPKVDATSLAALSQTLADVDIDAALARGDLAGSA